MPIKRTKKEAAMPDWESQAKIMAADPKLRAKLVDFAICTAALLDVVIGADNAWYNCGCSKTTFQPLLTLHIGDEVEYAGGRTFEDFIGNIIGLTDNPQSS